MFQRERTKNIKSLYYSISSYMRDIAALFLNLLKFIKRISY